MLVTQGMKQNSYFKLKAAMMIEKIVAHVFCLDTSWFSAMFLLVWVFFCVGCFVEIVVFAAVGGVLWDGFKQSTKSFLDNVKSKKNLPPISGRMIP